MGEARAVMPSNLGRQVWHINTEDEAAESPEKKGKPDMYGGHIEMVHSGFNLFPPRVIG